MNIIYKRKNKVGPELLPPAPPPQPPPIPMLKPWPPLTQHATAFGDGPFEDVMKVNLGQMGESHSHMAGVLVRIADKDTDTQRKGRVKTQGEEMPSAS